MIKPVTYIKLVSKDGKTLLSRYSTRKRVILGSLRRDNWQSAYVRTTYQRGVSNEGTYYNFADAKQAVSSFTEQSLLEWFYGK